MINKRCVIETLDGRRLFKLLSRDTPGTFTLVSTNGHIEEGVEVQAAYRFIAVIRANW